MKVYLKKSLKTDKGLLNKGDAGWVMAAEFGPEKDDSYLTKFDLGVFSIPMSIIEFAPDKKTIKIIDK